MKQKIRLLAQILLNLICVPMYYIPFIVGIGHLPDGNGHIIKTYFYHTPRENLFDIGHAWLMYTSLALIGISVLLSVLEYTKKENGKLRRISLPVSIVSVIFAALALLASTTVARGY